jgi:hypothetical protein
MPSATPNEFISPYQKTGGLVWFARMVRKLRLWDEGKLPPDYLPYIGRGFDRRCLDFLRINFDALMERVRQGGSDEEILEWCFQNGYDPSDTEILVWNEYMIKRGWRDTDAPANQFQDYKEKYGLGHRSDILTFFDFFEVDEGRKP